MRRVFMTAVAALVLASAVDSAGPPTSNGEWHAWAGDLASTRYAPLDPINKDTVKNLAIAWRQSANPDAIKSAIPTARTAPPNYQNTPLMAGGLLYISTGAGTIAALDAGTGQVVWFDVPPPPPAPAAGAAG